MIDVHEAAAFWGGSNNPFYSIEYRLQLASQALEFFGPHYEQFEAMLDDAPEEIWLVDDYHTSPEYRTDNITQMKGPDPEAWAVRMMEDFPGRFNYFIVKRIMVPFDE